jgi:hypothetical protein
MSVVELNAVTGVGQYLGHETLEFQEFFLRHVMFLLNYQPNFARIEHGRARRINAMRRDLPLVKQDARAVWAEIGRARQPPFDGPRTRGSPPADHAVDQRYRSSMCSFQGRRND